MGKEVLIHPMKKNLTKLLVVGALALAAFGAIGATVSAANLSPEERRAACYAKVDSLVPISPVFHDTTGVIALTGYSHSGLGVGLTDFDAPAIWALGKVTCDIEFLKIAGNGTTIGPLAQAEYVRLQETAWTQDIDGVATVGMSFLNDVGSPVSRETVAIGSVRHVILAEIGALPSSLAEFIAFVDGMASPFSCFPAGLTDAAGKPVFPAVCATADGQLPRPAALPLPPV